jgi:mannose-6-phosphate isomerase
LEHLNNKTVTDILNFDEVKKGDAYFIEFGRIHAIGAGVMVVEIQQTSDITYRIYDWDRLDNEGNKRELHNDLAIDAIDFKMPDNYRVDYAKTINQSNQMVSCPYFTTNYIDINTKLSKENTFDSFIIYICVEGKVEISTDNFSEELRQGETLLLPAAIKQYELNASSGKLLEVYI